MNTRNTFIVALLLAFSTSAFAVNTVQLREQQSNDIDFSSGKPQFKTGTIIKNGKAVEYHKCQYRDPADPNKQLAEQGVPYCSQ